VSYPNNYIFKPVAFRYRRTLSAGMASSLLARKKRSLRGLKTHAFPAGVAAFQTTCFLLILFIDMSNVLDVPWCSNLDDSS